MHYPLDLENGLNEDFENLNAGCNGMKKLDVYYVVSETARKPSQSLEQKPEKEIQVSNECKAVILWKDPMMIRIFLHFPEILLKVWR